MYSQKTSVNNTTVNQTVYLDGSVSLDSLTRLIHKTTHSRIAFNSTKIKSSTKIHFTRKNYTIRDILHHISKATSLVSSYHKGYIIIRDKPQPNTIKHKIKLQNNSSKKVTLHSSSTTLQKSVSLPKLSVLRVTGAVKRNQYSNDDSSFLSLLTIQTPDLVTLLPKTTNNQRTVIPPSAKNNSYASKKNRPVQREVTPYVYTGIYANEVFYTNVSAEVGLERIHILLNAGTNYNVNHIGFGVGSVIYKKNYSQLKLNAGIQFLKKVSAHDDTISSKKITIKGRLYSFGLQWRKTLPSNPRWQFGIGISYNQMKSYYYLNNILTIISDLPVGFRSNEKNLQMLSQPVKFNNNNNNQSTSSSIITVWPGVSAGIYFKFL